MTVEDRLAQAIEARTAAVEPSLDDGRRRIDEKLLSPGPPGRPETSPGSDGPRRLWLLAAAALVVLAAVVGGVVLAGGGDSDDIDTIGQPRRPDTTATTVADERPETPATTEADGSSGDTPPGSSPSTTTPPDSPGAPADVLQLAVWPRPSSAVRFDDPAAAARSFALYLAQFSDPVVGEFRPGDSRSGEVPVRPTTTGPETTVLVRQLGDDSWYVIGSVTEDIVVDQPAAGATLGSPQPLSGRALAFEGTVGVQLLAYRLDGRSDRLAQTFVTGSGSPPAGPFIGSVDWTSGTASLEPTGVLVLSTADESGELGGAWQVVAIPVSLGG